MHIIFIVIYGLTLYSKYYLYIQPFLNYYLADLLCMPIVFYLTVEIFRIAKLEPKLSLLKILIGIIYFFILFEFLLPKYSFKYTGDWFDVFMYFLGGLIYFTSFKVLNPYRH